MVVVVIVFGEIVCVCVVASDTFLGPTRHDISIASDNTTKLSVSKPTDEDELILPARPVKEPGSSSSFESLESELYESRFQQRGRSVRIECLPSPSSPTHGHTDRVPSLSSLTIETSEWRSALELEDTPPDCTRLGARPSIIPLEILSTLTSFRRVPKFIFRTYLATR